MAIKTNLVDLTSARERFRTAIPLLSGGFSAPHVFKEGKVVIYPWTTETSEWFVELAKKNTGLSLTRLLLAKLTGLKSEEVDLMVASEAMLVLLIARALSTQHKIVYTCSCTHCNAVQREATIIVPDQLEKVGEKSPDYPGYDEVTLPESKDVVRVRPILIADEIAVENRSKLDQVKCSGGVARTLASIVAVGGGNPDNLDELLRYYRALSPSDVEFLERNIEDLSPRLNTRIRHSCEKCDREFDHDLGLDATFFRSVRR